MKVVLFLLASAWLGGCSQPIQSGEDAGVTNNHTEADATATTTPDVPERPSIEVRVATFNTGRFFDTVCDSNNCDDTNDFERQLSQAEFNFKVSQIAGGIEKLDADIITLQEVENQASLDALLDALPEYDFGVIGEIGGTATLDVAIIARNVTHLETRTHRNNTVLQLDGGREQRFARELLEAHFEHNGERIIAFSAHFKAKRNDDPAWRLGEARGARTIAEASQAEFPNALVYLGGDLNDEPGSPPLVALTGSDGLVLVTRELAAEDAWTYGFVSKSAIDHILYIATDKVSHIAEQTEVMRDTSGAFAGSDHAALKSAFRIYVD